MLWSVLVQITAHQAVYIGGGGMSTPRQIYLPRERWRRPSWTRKHLSPLADRLNAAVADAVKLFRSMIYRPKL